MPPTTAFTETARALQAQLREAAVDHPAFETLFRPCDLSRCRASCCHDGAILSPEEASTIRDLLGTHPETMPVTSLADPIVASRGSLKTATRPAASHERADDYPAHFPHTRCVFLDDEHKCGLQCRSVSLGHPAWYFKPISCWMHPVLLRPAAAPGERPLLTLRHPESDPLRFASCTHCGRPDPDGRPAREVLLPELRALSEIAERDFVRELNAPARPRS